jgi:hypothetical protein
MGAMTVFVGDSLTPLPQALDAWGDGVRASPLGPKPVGVLIPWRLGPGLPRLEIDRLSGPAGQDGDRQRARLAVFLGTVHSSQGCGPIALPPAEARHGMGCLRWGIPEGPIYPGRLIPSILGPPLDGSGARHPRVAHPRAQARDLAPRTGQDGLDDTPWQRSSPAMAGRPVVPVPRCRRQARGRLEYQTTQCKLSLGWTVCLVGLVRSHPRDVSRLAAQGHV